MRKAIRSVLILGSIILTVFAFSSFRAHQVAIEAAQYEPVSRTPVLVHAGTKIQAVVRHAIAESAAPGRGVVATVAKPLAVEGRVVIPAGAELTGKLEQVTFMKSGPAKARMNFDALFLLDRSFMIHARPIELTVPVESDIEIVSSAIRALMSANIGAATGAAAGDPRIMDWAMLRSAALSKDFAIPITVTLTQDLVLKT